MSRATWFLKPLTAFAALVALMALQPAVAQTEATSPESCLPPFLALQADESVSSQTQGFTHRLRTLRAGSFHPTKVLLDAKPDSQEGWLDFKVQFDPDFDGVSLAYNLYAVLLIVDGEPWGWFDFTENCKGPGMSFFPGQSVKLPHLKLPPTGTRKLKIMIWGRI